MSNTDICPNAECREPLHFFDEKCELCGESVPSPTQRQLMCVEEKQALDDLYQQAKSKANKAGCEAEFLQLEQVVAESSHAVINFEPLTLASILKNNSIGITNYHMQVESQTRKPFSRKDDIKRTKVDAACFGSFSKKIIFAALSVNNEGLHSYGCCCATIKDVTMGKRATLLWENSFNFVENHNLTVADEEFPIGYRATWCDRQKLVMAKVVDKLITNPNYSEAQQLIMFCEGNRFTDEFVEVHVYGVVIIGAISVITLPDPKKVTGDSEIQLNVVIDLAKNLGKEVRFI